MIKRAQQALRNAIDPALADLGLTKAQYAALYNLRRHSGASSAEHPPQHTAACSRHT